MKQSLYDKTYELENKYWWYLSRRYIFDKVLTRFFSSKNDVQDKKILDFGCGTGGVIPMLSKHGQVLGLDVEPRALDFCRSKGFNNVALMNDYYDTGQPDSSADLVSLFDVLEHFEDDRRALKEINRVLRVGGYTLISVPAFKSLWSDLDEVAHHFRRYTKKELSEKLNEAGFEPVKSSYLFFFLFPLVVIHKLFGKSKTKKENAEFRVTEFPSLINKILVWPSRLEAFLLRFASLPFGSTLMILAKKVK